MNFSGTTKDLDRWRCDEANHIHTVNPKKMAIVGVVHASIDRAR
jgi:hypothetical protein